MIITIPLRIINFSLYSCVVCPIPHHIRDGFGGLDLHGVGSVGEGVGAQGEAGIGMTQHAGDGADDSATAFTVHSF